jgi:hypothetical protein
MTNSVVTNNSNNGAGDPAGIETGPAFQMKNSTVSNNRTLPGTACGGVTAYGFFNYDATGFLIENSKVIGNKPCGILLWAGTFNVRHTTVSNNGDAEHPGGGINAYFVIATLNGLTVSNNTGPGVSNFLLDLAFSNLSVSNSTITGNHTDGSGGGVMSELNATTSITNSTITGNRARLDGGGIFGFLTITDSKITGNQAGRYGGGLAGGGTITRSQIEHNEAGVDGGGIWNMFGVSLIASVVRNNIPNDCVNAPTSPPTAPC